MGSGIAQVAAAAGHRVVLSDSKAGATAKARESMSAGLAKLVEKGKLDAAARERARDLAAARDVVEVGVESERGDERRPRDEQQVDSEDLGEKRT